MKKKALEAVRCLVAIGLLAIIIMPIMGCCADEPSPDDRTLVVSGYVFWDNHEVGGWHMVTGLGHYQLVGTETEPLPPELRIFCPPTWHNDPAFNAKLKIRVLREVNSPAVQYEASVVEVLSLEKIKLK